MAENNVTTVWNLHSRIKFAKAHGYRYGGNGWFFPVGPSYNFMCYFKSVKQMSVHERINLKHNRLGDCIAYGIHPALFILRRLKSNRFYAFCNYISPFAYGVSPSVK